ncbi:hypothetical protein ACEPAI_7539 [Sanghuangporus weigelae]
MDLYEPREVIGHGSYGLVRKVLRKSDGEIFARKEIKYGRMTRGEHARIMAEVNTLKHLNHENIIRYIDDHDDKEAGILYIVMEYCDGGDLALIIKRYRQKKWSIDEEHIWTCFSQLLLALQCCHCPTSRPAEDGAGQILHRDLKPENVFISKGNAIKLGDFGLSKALIQTSLTSTPVGTPYYMSPEIIQGRPYGTKSDIWSLGCVIYELCALSSPFVEVQTDAELSHLILNSPIPPLSGRYSDTLFNLIILMLNRNPILRPSVEQLLQHVMLYFSRKATDTNTLYINTLAILDEKEAEISRLRAYVVSQHEAQKGLEGEFGVRLQIAEQAFNLWRMRREEEFQEAWQRREEHLQDELLSQRQLIQAFKKELDEIHRELKVQSNAGEETLMNITISTT